LYEDFSVVEHSVEFQATICLLGRESDAATSPRKSTKVGSIKRVLFGNFECYNAAGEFSEIDGDKTL
jgi:hypothetical protein